MKLQELQHDFPRKKYELHMHMPYYDEPFINQSNDIKDLVDYAWKNRVERFEVFTEEFASIWFPL